MFWKVKLFCCYSSKHVQGYYFIKSQNCPEHSYTVKICTWKIKGKNFRGHVVAHHLYCPKKGKTVKWNCHWSLVSKSFMKNAINSFFYSRPSNRITADKLPGFVGQNRTRHYYVITLGPK